MEQSPDEKKVQKVRSGCKLATALAAGYTLERKESPVNPYNRSRGPTRISPCRQCEDLDDNEISLVNSLLQFDCGPAAKSYTETCSCPVTSDNRTGNNAEQRKIRPFPGCCEMHWNRKEAFRRIKARVDHALRAHKIFLIRGELPKLKEALEERGWIQKYESTRTRGLPYGSVGSLEARSLGNLTQPDGTLNERAVIFALLRRKTPDFIWDCRNDFVDWHPGLDGNILLNRYQKPAVYTSKLGMARLLEEAHWLNETNVSSVSFPRSYNPSKEPEAFVEDFRLTAAAGLLRWFVQKLNESEHSVLGPPSSGQTIPLSRLEFAVDRCESLVARLNHQNIDQDRDGDLSSDDWDGFLNDYNAVLHGGCGLEVTGDESWQTIRELREKAVSILERLKSVDPQYELNGMRNIWILKPSDLCCGAGISISHNLKDILRRVKGRPKNYFIVQKYIEKPLLIQETKFDIRQWYLVTSTFPLTIWMFKEGLLRFSSKPYTFSTYHEAIHICNTAVQERYEEERRRQRRRGNSEEVAKSVRDQAWDCQKLNEYLKELGYEGEPYYEKIYGKMSEAIVLTMLAAQEQMDRRGSSFELYGADFVVMEDLSVWLIEINTNPRMHPPSSRITKRLYSGVLESLVKVVIDLPQNPNADTGGFALAYNQTLPEFRPYLGPCLFVFGKSIPVQPTPWRRERKRKPKPGNQMQLQLHSQPQSQSQSQSQSHRAWTAPPIVPRLRDPKIVDFMDCLNCTMAN